MGLCCLPRPPNYRQINPRCQHLAGTLGGPGMGGGLSWQRFGACTAFRAAFKQAGPERHGSNESLGSSATAVYYCGRIIDHTQSTYPQAELQESPKQNLKDPPSRTSGRCKRLCAILLLEIEVHGFAVFCNLLRCSHSGAFLTQRLQGAIRHLPEPCNDQGGCICKN